MANDRSPRDVDTRAQQARPQQWMPPELLPEPDKQPGYAYRWIRVASLGQIDPRNISSKTREGWEPVMLEEQPKFKLLADSQSRFQGTVEIGGLMLCKTPIEMLAQRAAYYADMTRKQTEAVDANLMRQSDPRMPIFKEGKSTVSFGRGNN